MKIKTNREQLEGVFRILAVMMSDNAPQTIDEEFVYIEVDRLFKKIRAKVEALYSPKAGWGIQLTDQEARALYLFIRDNHVPQILYQYEAIQLQSISSIIDQEYGSRIKAIG